MTSSKLQQALLPVLVLAALVSNSGSNIGLAAEPGTPSSPYPPGAASPMPSVAPEAQPAPTNTGATSGTIFIGGKQSFVIHSVAGNSVDQRFQDIQNRVMSVIQPAKSNTALATTAADVSVRIKDFQPVVYLKENAIVTVTNEDADQAHTDPMLLANMWAGKLKDAMSTFQVGEMLPQTWMSLKLGSAGPLIVGPRKITGNRLATTAGQVTYTVKNGVVTLNGAVESNYERAMAEVAVRRIPAVLQVVNNIQVHPRIKLQLQKAKDTDLQRQVGEQLDQVISR